MGAEPIPAAGLVEGRRVIRTVRIPTRVNRMGLVQVGDGGSASDYTFDPLTGLSNDPQLSYPLQNLTPAQLQTGLTNPGGVTQDLIAANNALISGSGLPCGTTASGDPTCGAAGATAAEPLNQLKNSFGSIPAWAWLAGGAGALVLVLRK
jgi:hypothetical protein